LVLVVVVASFVVAVWEDGDDGDDDVEAVAVAVADAAASAALFSASLVGKGICGRFSVAGLSDFMMSEISIVPVAAPVPPSAAAAAGFASDTSTEKVTAVLVPKELWGKAIAGVDHPTRRTMAVATVTAFDRRATFFHNIGAVGIIVTTLPLSVQQ